MYPPLAESLAPDADNDLIDDNDDAAGADEAEAGDRERDNDQDDDAGAECGVLLQYLTYMTLACTVTSISTPAIALIVYQAPSPPPQVTSTRS